MQVSTLRGEVVQLRASVSQYEDLMAEYKAQVCTSCSAWSIPYESVHTYTHTHMYSTYIHTHIHICTVHTYIHAYTHVQTMYIQIHTCTCIHTYIQIHTCTYVHTYIQIHICTYIHTYIHILCVYVLWVHG